MRKVTDAKKANWTGFSQYLEEAAAGLTNLNGVYDLHCKMMLAAANTSLMVYSVCKAYVPCWDDEHQDLLCFHKDSQTNKKRGIAANYLLFRLDEKRRRRWTEMVE